MAEIPRKWQIKILNRREKEEKSEEEEIYLVGTLPSFLALGLSRGFSPPDSSAIE
jgi:hypothetical protein